MKKGIIKIRNKSYWNFTCLFLLIIFFWALSMINISYSQDIRWLRVAELQSPINETGAEYEVEFNQTGTTSNFFSWPAQYGIDQTCTRMKGLWIGCRNFDDRVAGEIKSIKVIGSGPKSVADPYQIFPQEIKLIGKKLHPVVTVDGSGATALDTYDILDEIDENLPCDRMVLVKFNTSMGISVTKKVMSFANSEHGDYFINDYVFKNTGIYTANGDVYEQSLDSVWFYFSYRYAEGGVSVGGNGSNSLWGAFASVWGNSQINHSFGEYPSAPEFTNPNSPIYQMRGFYSWYGPSQEQVRAAAGYDGDWGCPKLDDPEAGTLGSAKYIGCVTIHADKDVQDQTDDLNQPRTTWFIGSDIDIMANTSPSQYDDLFMADRWAAMTEGHPPIGGHHDDIVEGIYPITYSDPRRQTGGGVSEGQGYGPYMMAPGDSVHIVFAEAVSGISWEAGRKIGSNWLQWRNGTGQPELKLPNGSTTTNYDEYKRAWVVDAGRDSIIKIFRNAMDNYSSSYNLPQPPDPPSEFSVTGGGDRIRLTWSDNADSDPHFNGYVIYRSRGNVLDWDTHYQKIFECNASNVVHTYDDVNAVRGFDYYYYIQSKDDGTQVPGIVLYSSLFWTVTNVPAVLGRPAVTGPPAPPESDTTNWKYLTDMGNWDEGTQYQKYDWVSYLGSNYVCVSPIDSIVPGTDIIYWRVTTRKGDWVSGNAYNAYDVVTYNGSNFVTPFSISGGSLLDLVRVVPNPYDIRGRIFQFGDQSQYDRIAFYGLPPVCKIKIFTERGDLIYEKDHTNTTGDEIWDSKTSSGQIVASGIYILYIETPEGKSVFRKFVVIR